MTTDQASRPGRRGRGRGHAVGGVQLDEPPGRHRFTAVKRSMPAKAGHGAGRRRWPATTPTPGGTGAAPATGRTVGSTARAGTSGTGVPGTAAAGPGQMAPGVTASEIKIGINLVKGGEAMGNLIGAALNFGDTEAQANAVVNYINSRGGIAGRKIVPVFYTFDLARLGTGRRPVRAGGLRGAGPRTTACSPPSTSHWPASGPPRLSGQAGRARHPPRHADGRADAQDVPRLLVQRLRRQRASPSTGWPRSR